MDSLLRGPSTVELDAGYSSAIPSTVKLLGAREQAPFLYVDVTDELTDLSGPFLGDIELVEPEPFTAISGDGTEVPAWVMRPPGFDPDTLYPAVLNIHGGPFTQYGDRLFDEFQMYAAAGYVVVYANPRGSSGYDESWGRAIRGPVQGGPGWGSVDFDDLMAVTDEAIKRFSDIVFDAGYASPVRTPRGQDIMAACGQLKSESIRQRRSSQGTSELMA